MTTTILPAKEEDIEGILAVQNKVLHDSAPDTARETNGFLIYATSVDELKQIIATAPNSILVAKKDDHIVGYALTYDLAAWEKYKQNWNAALTIDPQEREHLHKDKTVYFRHIARLPGSEGVGAELEKTVYTLAKEQGYATVLGEIAEAPVPNALSKRVHEQRGYQRIGDVHYPDGTAWGLYKKSLKQEGIDTIVGTLALFSLAAGASLSSGVTANVLGYTGNTSMLGQLLLGFGLVSGVYWLYLFKKRTRSK